MGSSDLSTPYACPSDVFFMTKDLDAVLDYRVAAWLESPRVRTSLGGCAESRVEGLRPSPDIDHIRF